MERGASMAKSRSKSKKNTLSSKTYEIQKNKINKETGEFKTKRKWYDYKGCFFLIPTIIYEKNIDLNVDTKINRVIIAFGYKRWSFDKGVYFPQKTKLAINVNEMDEFIKWCKLKTSNNWNSQDVHDVFKFNKAIENIVKKDGFKKHYVKLMLLKEMIDLRKSSNILDNDPAIVKRGKIKSSRMAEISNNGNDSDGGDSIDAFLNEFNKVIE